MIGVNVINNDREKTIKQINALNIPEISKIFPSNYDLFGTVSVSNETNEVNGFIEVYGNYKGINYKLDSGRYIKNDNEMICPTQFYPGNYASLTDNSKMINMKDKLDTNFKIKYDKFYHYSNGESKVLDSFTSNFKIVGTFDVNETLIGNNVCFISKNALETILMNSKAVYENPGEVIEQMKDLSILVLIDKYENLDLVMNKLKTNGFDAENYYTMDTEFLTIIETIIIYLLIVVCIISNIILSLFIKNTLNENQKNIFLYKIIGYKDKEVKIILSLHYILLTLISFILSIILLPLIKMGVVAYLSNKPLYSVLPIHLSFIEVIYYLIFVLFLIVLIINRKFRKVKVVNNLLREK